MKHKLLLVSLFILWMFFVLASFFAVQKPFAGVNVLAVGRALLDIAVASWLALVGLGLGLWLWRRFGPEDVSLAEQVVFGTGIGLGILGLFGLGIGLLGLFRPLAGYGLMLGLTALAAPQLWRLWQRSRQGQLTRGGPGRLATIYLALIGALALALALLPPTDWDGLFYHLTGPSRYLQAGGISGGFDVPHYNFPALMEMLFAWAMLLWGDIAAKLIHLIFGLLLASLVYLTARRFLGQKAAWPAVLIVASMPMLGTLAGWAYNDLALAFYQLSSLYAIMVWKLEIKDRRFHSEQWVEPLKSKSKIQNLKSKIQNRSWLILSGLFAGLAMGLKYTSFVTPVVVGGIILWQALRAWRSSEQSPSMAGYARGLSHFAIFSAVALAIASPWYLKNWAFTGNPFYPFLYDIFGGQFWDSFRAGWYAAAGTGIGWKPGTLLTLPWLLTLGVRDANYWDGRTGPLLLLFLPLIVGMGLFYRAGDRPRGLSLLLIYALAHFVFWTVGVIWSQALWQSRLLLPGLVGLAPAAGWAWTSLARFDLPQLSLSRLVNVAVGLTLALTVLDVGLLTLRIDPVPYLVGLESRDDYLTRRLGAHYAAMQELNQVLPPEARVVFLWEPRSYYCRGDCQPDSILDKFPHLSHQYGSAGAIAAAWREANVTHVLIHRTGLNFVLSDLPETIDRDILAELETEYFESVFDIAGAYQLYSLDTGSYKP